MGKANSFGIFASLGIAVDGVMKVVDWVEEKQKDTMIIPALYSKGQRLTVDMAMRILTDMGMKPQPVELSVVEAKEKYRTCIPRQVVFTSPRDSSRQKIGQVIVITYITEPGIEESKRLYDEHQKQIAIDKEKHAQKVAEHKQAAIDMGEKVKEKVIRVVKKKHQP